MGRSQTAAIPIPATPLAAVEKKVKKVDLEHSVSFCLLLNLMLSRNELRVPRRRMRYAGL